MTTTTTGAQDLFLNASSASAPRKHPRFSERAPVIYSVIGGANV